MAQDLWLNDEDYQTKLKLIGLFEHAGWKIFEAELNKLFEYHDYWISKYTENVLSVDNLAKLNEHIADKRALSRVLGIKDSLIEEYISPNGEGVKDNPEEVNEA